MAKTSPPKKAARQPIKAGRAAISKAKPRPAEAAVEQLLGEIRQLIQQARNAVAQTANAGLVLLNWHLGQRIRQEILGEERAEYGEQIVQTLSGQLAAEYGRGFTYTALTRMIRFAERFPHVEIVATLSQQLSWSHFIEIIPLKGDLQRDFYAEMCRIERWSVRALRSKIGGMLYERTALSRNTEEFIREELDALREEDRLTPDLVFRDPYFLDFLNLPGRYSEKDLEDAILRELERFLLEFGSDFAFVARQKRMTVGGEDFYLDLLFYHRRLRRLIAVELKLDKFRPADQGQMHLYLAWLNRYERQRGENKPIGLILCAGKSDYEIELLELGKGYVRVAEYWTELPPRELLEAKLHEAIRLARARLGKKRKK